MTTYPREWLFRNSNDGLYTVDGIKDAKRVLIIHKVLMFKTFFISYWLPKLKHTGRKKSIYNIVKCQKRAKSLF